MNERIRFVDDKTVQLTAGDEEGNCRDYNITLASLKRYIRYEARRGLTVRFIGMLVGSDEAIDVIAHDVEEAFIERLGAEGYQKAMDETPIEGNPAFDKAAGIVGVRKG